MKNAGNNICKNVVLTNDITNEPKDSKFNALPNTNDNKDKNIVTNAIKNAISDIIKMVQSFFEVDFIFSINNVLSIFLDPILSAAENLTLHI